MDHVNDINSVDGAKKWITHIKAFFGRPVKEVYCFNLPFNTGVRTRECMVLSFYGTSFAVEQEIKKSIL